MLNISIGIPPIDGLVRAKPIPLKPARPRHDRIVALGPVLVGRMGRIQENVARNRYILLSTYLAAKAAMLNEHKLMVTMGMKAVMNIGFRKNRIGVASHRINL